MPDLHPPIMDTAQCRTACPVSGRFNEIAFLPESVSLRFDDLGIRCVGYVAPTYSDVTEYSRGMPCVILNQSEFFALS